MTISAEHPPARLPRPTAWALSLFITFTASVGVAAQPAEDPVPASKVQLELLLGSDQVLNDSVNGPVWDVTPTPGRRFVQLPMRITPVPGVTEPVALEEPAFDFLGGRFLFWVLPDDESTSSSGRTSNAELTGPSDEELLNLTELLTRPEEDGPRGRAQPVDAEPERLPEVPPVAPRLARELFISSAADGTPRVAWEITRAIPGGEVKSGGETEPYSLLLDREQLEALEPERPERITRSEGESTREFSFRRREADAEYRELARAYRDLQIMVRELPDRFEQDLPETVWAVFEVNAFGEGWMLRGHESGPWSMGFDDWETLTELASGRGGRNATGDGDFSAEELAGITRLTEVAGDPHPWTQQLLSTALAASDLSGRAFPGDPATDLLAAVLASPDLLARNRMAYALARVDPATPAVAEVLADAARQTGDPALQLAALRAELGVQLADAASTRGAEAAAAVSEGVAGAISVTNTMLANEQGPDAGLVIEQLLASIPDTPETDTAVIAGVRFDNLPGPRFDAAVGAVLRSAGQRPEVVGGWLNLQLLGSNDARLVNRTLDLMARADEPAPVVASLSRGLRGLVFASADGDAEAPPTLAVDAGLPLDSANHALFRLLNSGDPALRQKGWQVLRLFELTDQPTNSRGRRGTPTPTEDTTSDPLTMIVDAGLSQPKDTPSSLVPFLARQPDADRANGPLLRVVVEGDPAASRRAVRVLRGSERSFGSALGEMATDARAEFANRVYEAIGDGPEPVSGLMRTENRSGRNAGGVIGWFAEQLAEGTLPDPADWGEAAGGESNLMQAAVGTDEALAAGAFAALTAMAGGDRELQYKMYERFKDVRTTKTSQTMAEAWIDARQDIYTARLESAAGEYRLVMIVTGLAPEDGGVGLASDPVLGSDPSVAAARDQGAAVAVRSEKTTLGVSRLVADGRTLRFSSGQPALGVPEDRLAIRITTPSQLKSFGVDEVKELPLEQAEDPLDLLPEPEGTWRGKMMLADGRELELIMEPWGGVEKPEDEDAKSSPSGAGGELKRKPFGD